MAKVLFGFYQNCFCKLEVHFVSVNKAAVYYFHKKKSIVDVQLGSKYVFEGHTYHAGGLHWNSESF